jgi:hypothetical protein
MAASFYEKPTEIRERLNSSGSDDFGGFFFPFRSRLTVLVRERRLEG